MEYGERVIFVGVPTVWGQRQQLNRAAAVWVHQYATNLVLIKASVFRFPLSHAVRPDTPENIWSTANITAYFTCFSTFLIFGFCPFHKLLCQKGFPSLHCSFSSSVQKHWRIFNEIPSSSVHLSILDQNPFALWLHVSPLKMNYWTLLGSLNLCHHGNCSSCCYNSQANFYCSEHTCHNAFRNTGFEWWYEPTSQNVPIHWMLTSLVSEVLLL